MKQSELLGCLLMAALTTSAGWWTGAKYTQYHMQMEAISAGVATFEGSGGEYRFRYKTSPRRVDPWPLPPIPDPPDPDPQGSAGSTGGVL